MAHFACSQTSFSLSFAADCSTGRMIFCHEFPAATAAFLKYPRRLARLSGLFLNFLLNSCGVSASSFCNEGCATPGRGAKDRSPLSGAKRIFHGQTTWQMSQPKTHS